MTTFRIAIVASALGTDSRQIPRAARAMGFAGLQFPAQSALIDLLSLSQSGRRDFRHMLAASDQILVSLAVDTGAKGLMPGADIDRVMAHIDSAMESAAGLGCSTVCLDPGPLPATTPNVPGKGQVEGDPPSPADSALAEIGRRADRYGITVALRTELSPLSAIERALRAADCQWLGIDMDPAGLLRDSWDADQAFSSLGRHTKHVRARDAVVGSSHLCKPVPIGQGSTDWAALLQRLNNSDYHGWLTIDPTDLPDRPAAARSGLAYLRSLC
jgi:sugar phosphate isomerase/epimerase